METYAEKSVSNVLYLILEGCGMKNIHADHAASHLGKAQGLVQQIRYCILNTFLIIVSKCLNKNIRRTIPLARKMNFIPIPQEILIKNKVSEEDVLRAINSDNLMDCTYEIAVRAQQHLTKARSLIEKVPHDVRSVLLPAVPVYIYLDNLQKVNYDVFHSSLKIRSWKLLPYLWFYNFKNKY